MDKFSLEKFILDSIKYESLAYVVGFSKAHGYSIRVVTKWNEKKGKWTPQIITRDYKKKRINVALGPDNTIHHIEGLG